MSDVTDGAVLLQNTLALTPTHLVVVNLDERLHYPLEEMAAFLPSLGVTILHVHEGEHATVPLEPLTEAQVVRMLPETLAPDLEDANAWAAASYRFHRPAILRALRAAFKAWHESRRHERTVLLFAGAMRSAFDAVYLSELPLDAEALFFRRTGALPLALRFLVAPRRPFEGDDDLPLARFFDALDQIYFVLPDFPVAVDEPSVPAAPSSSPFDTTVWVDGSDGSELLHFLRDLLRLHGEENARLAGNYPAEQAAAPHVSPIDLAIQAEAGERSIDWLSLCAHRFAPRLWTHGLPALASVLFLEPHPARRKDPLAAIGLYEREASWDANPLVASYLSRAERPRAPYRDLSTADFPYRITDEDGASKLEMSRRLSDLGEFERAAELAAELLEDDPHHRLLTRLLGTDLYVAGHRDRAASVLRRCIALTEIDPDLGEAERAAELATLHHLLRDYDAAVSGYERAIAVDPRMSHAYEGLVLIHRGRGEEEAAERWLAAARARDLSLPLLATEGPEEDVFAPERDTSGERTPEVLRRRSRWWSFLRR